MKDDKEQLDRIEAKVDKVDQRLDKVDTHMAVYNQELKDHIRRTELLEDAVKPIQEHVHKVTGALKVIASTGIILSIIKVLEVL